MLALTREVSLADSPGSLLFPPKYSTPVPKSPAEIEKESETRTAKYEDTRVKENCYSFSKNTVKLDLLYAA